METLKDILKLLPIVGLALYSLFHWTVKLQKDPYKRFYQVEFRVVQGLTKKSKVTARGVQVGRVDKITLNDEDGTVLVRIKVFPRLLVSRRDSKFTIVSQNNFGVMRINIVPGTPQSDADVYKADEVIKGINPTSSAFVELLKRRDPIIGDYLQEIEDLTGRAKDPNSTLGQLLFNPENARSFKEQLKDFRASVAGTRASMKDIEDGQGPFGAFVSTNPIYRENLNDTVRGVSDQLSDLKDSLSSANQGQGNFGGVLMDENRALQAKQSGARFLQSSENLRQEDGFLLNNEPYENFATNSGNWAKSMANINNGQGRFGQSLSSPASVRQLDDFLDDLRTSLKETARGEGGAGRFLTDPDARDQFEAVLKRIRQLTKDADEGLQRSVATQPVNTIHGAVFSIF